MMAQPQPTNRLAVYGTLRPGHPNHHHLADLGGTWRKGVVHGTLFEIGWGAAIGYPGLVLNPTGPEVEVDVLESMLLPDEWQRLDAFEGKEYRRVLTEIGTDNGTLDAHIYVVAVGLRGTR